MKGKVLGINLFLDEVVTEYQPPRRKVWKTVENPKLIVIGNYQMGVEISSQNDKSKITVFIDYELPKGIDKLIGYIFGEIYAKWCVKQMLSGVKENFKFS